MVVYAVNSPVAGQKEQPQPNSRPSMPAAPLHDWVECGERPKVPHNHYIPPPLYI